jgi:hypothetical protein
MDWAAFLAISSRTNLVALPADYQTPITAADQTFLRKIFGGCQKIAVMLRHRISL